MPLHHDDHRREPGGLEARRLEERDLDAVCAPRLLDLVRRADLLAVQLEARRPLLVDDAERTEALVDAARHLEHALGALRLVSVEGRAARVAPEHVARAVEHPGDERVVGHDEARELLGWAVVDPLVVGEDADRPAQLAHRHAAGDHIDDERSGASLFESGEAREVQVDEHLLDRARHTRTEPFDAGDERRGGPEAERHADHDRPCDR